MKNLVEIAEDIVKARVALEKAPENEATQEAFDIIEIAARDLCEHIGLDVSSLTNIERKRSRTA